ncbi:MAG: hypothetical protein RL115_2235 [Bacteroidota bacterium]|jgi:hypothetical protein
MPNLAKYLLLFIMLLQSIHTFNQERKIDADYYQNGQIN